MSYKLSKEEANRILSEKVAKIKEIIEDTYNLKQLISDCKELASDNDLSFSLDDLDSHRESNWESSETTWTSSSANC
jgi:hypothetical protein